MVKKTLKSNRIFLILPIVRDPSTFKREHVTNQTLEQYPRCFINYQQDDWVDYLHFADFSYNNAIHSSTKLTPFFANTGVHPH